MFSKNVHNIKRTLSKLQEGAKWTGVSVRRKSGWTSDNIVKSPLKPIEIPNSTLHEYVWQNLEKWPERTLSVCARTGRGYSYEQAFKLSNTFAANLRKKFKIQDGDVVAIMLPNVPDFPIVSIGILEAGGVITTINPVYTAHEVQRQLAMSKAKVIITMPDTVKVVKEAFNIAKINIPILVIKTNGEPVPEGTIVFNELTEDLLVDKSCLKEVRRSATDICFLPYSSGTTGMPKGVELSHRNIVANCEQICDPIIRANNDTTATHQDAVMTVLPLFHIYAASVIMFHKMSQGIKIVTLQKYKPEYLIESLERTKSNIIFAAPPLILTMTSHPAATAKSYQYLQTVVNGAAPLSANDTLRFFEKAERKLDFRQGYGLTETSPVLTMTPRGSENYDCVGIPIPNTDVKIVDMENKTLGVNKPGEILVKGPQVMRGYNNNPAANREIFTEDGWFRTGDIGTLDSEGLLYIKDRLKELIKVKGFQVPPAELEAVIRSHPSVVDVGVIGIPHRTDGERPKAFVVLKAGAKVSADDISAYVKERVAPFKIVRDVVFIDCIPKSAAGKILRRVLKEQYA